MYRKSVMIGTAIALLLFFQMTTRVTPQQPNVAKPMSKTLKENSDKDASQVKIAKLMSKDLKDNPDKEVEMITVEYPPGWEDPVHRHNAQAFVYVLEGSVVMQLKGQKEVTLKRGQTFYEGPDDIHIVGRNASKTKPARMLVLLIKRKGAPILVPVK